MWRAQRARVTAPAVYFAQELVNAPANYCNPVTLAQTAVDMAKKVGGRTEHPSGGEVEREQAGCRGREAGRGGRLAGER